MEGVLKYTALLPRTFGTIQLYSVYHLVSQTTDRQNMQKLNYPKRVIHTHVDNLCNKKACAKWKFAQWSKHLSSNTWAMHVSCKWKGAWNEAYFIWLDVTERKYTHQYICLYHYNADIQSRCLQSEFKMFIFVFILSITI
jgi:hypothetical protein